MEMKINGVNSTTISKLYVSSLQTPVPSKTEDRVQILGKNGTDFLAERYSDRNVKVSFLLKNINGNNEVREFMEFIKFQEEVLINFTNDKTIFYVGRFSNFENLEQVSPAVKKFDVVFICKPEIYNIINPAINLNLIVNEEYIKNNLTVDIDYVYKINAL